MNMDEAIQVSCIIDKLPPSWKHFKHTLKHKVELTLVELGSHLRIEESLRVQDSDKPKDNNVAGPSVVNTVEHTNSSRYNDNKGKRKHHDNTRAAPNKKAKPTCWKFGKTSVNVGNKANSSGTKGSVDGSSNSLKAFMSTSKWNDSILWHAKLGHVHFKRMQDMSKDGLILAFDMDSKECKNCMLTKITKKPFQKVKHETKVLELIHSDLCDLHATPSLGNKKYFVIFIDDASRFYYVYLLHTKDKALDKFKVFKIEVELQQESLIKRFKTDRGGLSQGFWGEAMLIACYLLNRVPNKRNRITPYENPNYLRVWGCKAVVRLPNPKLKNLGERGIECIFVGYVEHSKAFRFYVIEPNESVLINSIIELRDAIFDDNRFSSVPRPSLSILKGTKDIGGLVIPKEVTEKVVQQPEHELRKSKRNRTSKNFGHEFQLYLIEGTKDESHDVAFWKEAINDEMDFIMGNNTWVLADLSPGWSFRALDKSQGLDYFDTYAPMVRIGTIRLLIAMASIHNLIIHHMDVKTAFLNGELDEEVPKQWHQKFDEVVLSNVYLLNQADKCVYSKFDKSDKGVIICLYVDDMLIFGTDQV
ncbi:zinc finger, CCHC-type containing protein [Tanacetum coccineum]